ncbi:hypothetical protein DFO66_10225 [Brevibacterium sanguinis]|uniref:Uncharacterized protein n=2 Tax=Brevibacterium TaxID=1696 RepID=A0A366ILB1_9MICO|nr:hypothetical protein DFO66_10225 [Brevibacterium sanguinis]RBP73497.1 hypothetical protein DFO65_10225 [Brevibacterium celere]
MDRSEAVDLIPSGAGARPVAGIGENGAAHVR